jgi:hypothetical protein
MWRMSNAGRIWRSLIILEEVKETVFEKEIGFCSLLMCPITEEILSLLADESF